MIKLLAIGVWVVAVALGSSYVMASVTSNEPEKSAPPSYFEGLDYRKTDNITVPMIAKDAIQGYILARFVYTIDGKTVATMQVPPDPFILDEAFRQLYSTKGFDFETPSRFDLTKLVDSIRDSVNARYGQDVVHDVLVDQFDYIAKKDIRNGRPEAG